MRDAAAFALSRFGMGGRPGDRASIADPLEWAIGALDEPPDVTKLGALDGTKAMLDQQIELRMAKRQEKQDGGDKSGSSAIKKDRRQLVGQQISAHIRQSVQTETPVLERLALFWGNHFTVSGTNNQVRNIAAAFQREAIYPNLSGRFFDLLVACVTHPAMLIYLDNQLSVGPNSRAGRRRKKGLNENLAREIMELHTLGVDSGYSQADVTSFARILTGWTVDQRPKSNKRGQARFLPNRHEPGDHRLLGKQYQAEGPRQLVSALADLATHPSTARFIATKLARHYVADQPPAAAIDTIAEAFIRTDGHLPTVHRATFMVAMDLGEPFGKARAPYDYLIAMQRALGGNFKIFGKRDRLRRVLTEMGNSPFMAPGPDGWPDKTENWITPQGMIRRINIAQAVATRARGIDSRDLLENLYGESLSDETRQHVRRAESPRQGLAIALASPEMNFR